MSGVDRYTCGGLGGGAGDGFVCMKGALEPVSAGGSSLAAAALPQPIFIGGAPRSGTTLLRAIVDAHPAIACGPELRAIPALCMLLRNLTDVSGPALTAGYGAGSSSIDGAFAAAIIEFLEPMRRAAGKRRSAEKTPANVLHFETLRRLFPASPLIAIHRDPRDVAASLMRMDWREPSGARMRITTDIDAAAALWAASVDVEQKMEDDPLFLAVRYEDLVARPNRTIRAIFEFLREAPANASFYHEISFDAASGENEWSNGRVAEPIDNSSVGRWRRDLSAQDVRRVERVVGNRLEKFCYA